MDKTELTVSIETERLEALTLYLQKEKTTTLQKELGKMLEELSEKTVPEAVRYYFDSRGKKAAPQKPKRPTQKKSSEKEEQLWQAEKSLSGSTNTGMKP